MNREIRKLFAGRPPALAIFDLDGTLVDSAPDLVLAVDAMRQSLGFMPAGADKVRGWIGNGARNLVSRALLDCAVQPDEPALDHALEVFREHYTRVNGTASRLYPGVNDALGFWRDLGCYLAIVTNKPKLFADPLLKAMQIADLFDLVVGGECLPEKKPHPLPLLHVADSLGVDAVVSLMVGDSRNDVESARAAGMPVICRHGGYNYGEDIRDSKPDWVFSTFYELI